MRKLIYTNADGGSVEIYNAAPFFLQGISGFEAAKNNIYTTKSVNQDGATATGSSLNMSERTITGAMRADSNDLLEARRRTLSKVFTPKLDGTLRYICSDIDKVCSCKVETIKFGEIKARTQTFDVVLLCPNPFWQDIEESIQEIALWVGAFEFPEPDGLEIPAAQEDTGETISFTDLTEGDKFDALTAYALSQQTTSTQSEQLFDDDKATAGYIDNTDGTVKSSSYSNYVSKLVLISPSTDYKILGNIYTQPVWTVGLAWYDSVGAYISGVNYGGATGNGTYASPSTAYYVRYTVNAVDLAVSILELNSSTNIDPAFTPLSPSPDYPAPITGTRELTISDGTNSQVYETPEELWSLPDGVRSEYNFITGSGIKRTDKAVFDGSADENFQWANDGTLTVRFYINIIIPNISLPISNQILANIACDKLKNVTSGSTYSLDSEVISAYNSNDSVKTSIFHIRVLKSRMPSWSDSLTNAEKVGLFKTWLSSNPVTVIYELATPTAITGTAQDIPCYIPQTNVSVDSGEVYAMTGGGIEMGYRSPSLIVNVNNPGDVPCGMRIVFSALGEVENPYLLNVNTQEYFKITKTMVAGEVITVTTHFGNKRVVDVLDGVTSTVLNIDLESTFLQLETGDNLYRYYADDGIDNLECKIYYSPQYLGV